VKAAAADDGVSDCRDRSRDTRRATGATDRDTLQNRDIEVPDARHGFAQCHRRTNRSPSFPARHFDSRNPTPETRTWYRDATFMQKDRQLRVAVFLSLRSARFEYNLAADYRCFK